MQKTKTGKRLRSCRIIYKNFWRLSSVGKISHFTGGYEGYCSKLRIPWLLWLACTSMA